MITLGTLCHAQVLPVPVHFPSSIVGLGVKRVTFIIQTVRRYRGCVCWMEWNYSFGSKTTFSQGQSWPIQTEESLSVFHVQREGWAPWFPWASKFKAFKANALFDLGSKLSIRQEKLRKRKAFFFLRVLSYSFKSLLFRTFLGERGEGDVALSPRLGLSEQDMRKRAAGWAAGVGGMHFAIIRQRDFSQLWWNISGLETWGKTRNGTFLPASPIWILLASSNSPNQRELRQRRC